MSIDPLIYDYVSSEKDYPDKAVILEEGRGGDWIFIILEGQVKVKKRVAVHGFKGSEVQGYVLVPGLHFEGVFI